VCKFVVFGNFIASIFMVMQEDLTISKLVPLLHLWVKILLYKARNKQNGVL